MIFKQLFEPVSSTFTYLLGCEETGQALLNDPVMPSWQRDLQEINQLGLTLAYTLDTHIHADHITAARKLKQEAGSRIAHPARDNLACVDVPIEEGKPWQVGSIFIQPLHTPGHTNNHFAYIVDRQVFTGDALLIDGCGRTDFQDGDASTLYRSVHEKLFVLPDEQLVYPAHDYNNHRISCIGQEKLHNPRLGGGKTVEEFIGIMKNLKLVYPKFMDYALPSNRECGVCPTDVPENLQQYCDHSTHSRQG